MGATEEWLGPTKRMRVLLVDDHALFREGVALLLGARKDFQVVGEAANGRQAVDMARQLRPDVILMDVQMPVMGGLEATHLIKAALPEVKIIILTVSDDERDLFEAIKAGAQGYLLKNLRSDDFFDMLLGVSLGEAAISRVMATKMLEEFARQGRPTAAESSPASAARETCLTEREEEVLRLVALGSTNKDIAAALCITENTVKFHLRRIMEKLHLHNRAQAAAYAARTGLVRPTEE